MDGVAEKRPDLGIPHEHSHRSLKPWQVDQLVFVVELHIRGDKTAKRAEIFIDLPRQTLVRYLMANFFQTGPFEKSAIIASASDCLSSRWYSFLVKPLRGPFRKGVVYRHKGGFAPCHPRTARSGGLEMRRRALTTARQDASKTRNFRSISSAKSFPPIVGLDSAQTT